MLSCAQTAREKDPTINLKPNTTVYAQKIPNNQKKPKTLGVMRLESKINNFAVPFEERRGIWYGFNARVCGNVCVRERQMKHVTLFVMSSWAVHSFSTPRIKHSLRAFFFFFLTNGSLHTRGSLSRIFTLFTKAAKKKNVKK